MTLAMHCVVVVEVDAAIQSVLRTLFGKQGRICSGSALATGYTTP
jgi:hypothetical protein